MNNNKEKIYIGKSDLHGKGIFASIDIKKGETVFIMKGNKVKFLINNKKQAKIAGLNWVGFGKNEWIDPLKHCIFFNHSCNPNAGIKGHVRFVALRNIKKGEEVLFDYSLNEADIFWSIKCSCKNKQCRKTVKSIQFLPQKTFENYKTYVPKYFQKVYKDFKISNFNDLDNFQDKWISFIKKYFRV